jgi:hypothetical protein
MATMSALLTYMLVFCGAITVVLIVLVVYGNVLDSREDDQIYVNQTEQAIMAGEQSALIHRMNRLAGIIKVLAILSGITLLLSAGIWVWIGLNRS